MNWLQKLCQRAKPMPLPFDVPEGITNELESRGMGSPRIDERMSQETADMLQDQYGVNFLGAGNEGVAGYYDREGTDAVMKLTDSEREAKMCQYIQQIKPPCTPMIYDVQQVQYEPYELWAISMEKVQPIEEDSDMWFAANEMSYDLPYPNDVSESSQWIVEKYPNLTNFRQKYINMTECLLDHDIWTRDAHAANIGFDSEGNLVLLDIGKSNRG